MLQLPQQFLLSHNLTDRFLVAAPMMGDSKSRNLSKLGSLVPIWERGHHTKFQLPSPLIGRARRGQSFDPFWTPPNYVLALAENFSWQIFFFFWGISRAPKGLWVAKKKFGFLLIKFGENGVFYLFRWYL